jgi:hypothetical protein
MMLNRVVLAGLLVFISISTVANPAKQRIVLGVPEDVPGKYQGESDSRRVRVVFEKDGDSWKALPTCPDQDCLKTIPSEYPPEMTWTIAFDGKNLGQINSRTPTAYDFYSDVGLQDITSTGPIPTVGTKLAEFAGFGSLGTPLDRPLLANSQPYFRDPEVWKPAHLSTALVAALHQQFRKRFPNVKNCASPEENIAKPWPYGEQDIEMVTPYSSKNNWSVAELRLKGYRCDGPSDDPFDGQWFVINPEGYISFLGQDMWLVDAGDYDNDGKSEVVFAIDGYNRGGYELFYDDFKKHVAFEFGYH